MKVLVSGSTGLIGERLVEQLGADGHVVTRLVRDDSEGVRWHPSRGEIGDVSGFDGVVHLAGENVASGRWNKARKQRIRDSRVAGTRLLAEHLATAAQPPSVLVCASAVGIYGDRGDELLTEDSEPGADFLAEVAAQWEAAADRARESGIRVVHVRFGVVLSKHGGALAKMLPPFRVGLGGPVGDGQQWYAWITLDDAVRALRFALESDALAGPVNAVAPEPVRNRDFVKAVGHAVHRPAVVPLPAFAARLALGELADALLLASTRVVPRRLPEAGFEFAHPQLDAALAHVLAAE